MQGLFTFLIFILIAAVSTWMKNQNARSRTDDSPPGDVKPPSQPGGGSWEAELRRLLNEEQPPPPRPMPRPVQRPPLATPQTSARPATPPVVIKPVLVPRRPPPMPVPVPSAIETSAGQMAPMRESQQAYQRAQDLERGISTSELAPLDQSRRAYQRASQLDKTVAAHLDRVTGQPVLSTSVIRRGISPEVTQVVGLFRNARSARQAIIAAVILGPPRSLDETPASEQFS